MNDHRPIIGITCDLAEGQFRAGQNYADRVWTAGGLPFLLPCVVEAVGELADRCQAVILTGGDDPIMAQWGVPQHPKATPVHPRRQAFELALLDWMQKTPAKPVLGICLGMQYMGLHAGGRLNQHLPDALPTASDHWSRNQHDVMGELGSGRVESHHRQAIEDPGRLRVVASSPDGVIEAISDLTRPYYLGVQWHPERTDTQELGQNLFDSLVMYASDRSPGGKTFFAG